MMEKKLGWFVSLEVLMNELAMSIKSFTFISIIAFAAQALIGYLLFTIGLLNVSGMGIKFEAIKLWFSNFPAVMLTPEKFTGINHVASISFDLLGDDFFKMYMWTSPIFIVTFIIGMKTIKRKSDDLGKSEFIRGAKLVDEKEQIKNTKHIDSVFSFGSVPIPHMSIFSHLLIIGSSGAGKTQLLKKNVYKAVKKQLGKNLIHDIKGDWTSELYSVERGDMIFSPMDVRSVKWTVWNDIHDVLDIKNFCDWVVPDVPGVDPFWRQSARAILESIMLYLWDNELITNAEIKRLVNLPGEELAELLEGIGRGSSFAKKNDSYMTLQSLMVFIDFLEDGNFSIREFVTSDKPGNLFLLNNEKSEALMRPVLSLFINFFGSNVLSLSDSMDRMPIHMWLDEFTSLQKLPKVIDLLKLGRSKLCAVILAFQDFQQLEKIYSKQDMYTVINNTASVAVLRLKEPEAALYFSKRFGKQEHKIKNQTMSMGVAQNRDGISLSDQVRDDFVVKDSEILTLPSLWVFAMIEGIEGVTKIQIQVTQSEQVALPFMQRNMSKKEQIALFTKLQSSPKQKTEEDNEKIFAEDVQDGSDESFLGQMINELES